MVTVLRNALYSALNEPAVPDPPVRVWRDWALLGALISTAVIEVIVRTELAWPVAMAIVYPAVISTVLWRRTRPLAMLVVTLATFHVIEFLLGLDRFGGPRDPDAVLYTSAFVLILVYAVFRWAPGRHCAIAVAVMAVVLIYEMITNYTGLGEAIGGALVFFLPAEIGALVRNRITSLRRQMEETKLRERELLARELHDTVAHHVSAIAIRAQAGRAMAPGNPQAAIDALEVIEEEASRTLSEMRTMVGALRSGEAAELAPQPGIRDIEKLAADSDAGLPIQVEMTGELESLRPSIDTALYRIAQESITNAVRHARRASQVRVSITGDSESVRLTVRDDGHDGPAIPGRGVESGREQVAGERNGTQRGRFGLVGMAERAKLLGGVFQAGPCPDGGWLVDVVFPRG